MASAADLNGNQAYEEISELGYDYIEDTPTVSEYHAKQGDSSSLKVVFNYMNAIVGAGIVGLPFALKEAGFLFGLVLLVFMVWISHYSVCLLIKTGVVERVRNYEELVERLFGFYGYVTIMCLLFFFDYGAMITYLIILGDVSSDVAAEIAKNAFELTHDQEEWIEDRWNLRRCTIGVICLVTIFPLCLFRDMAKLERFSVLSVTATASVTFVCLYASLIEDNCPDGPSSCPDPNEDWFTIVGDNPASAFGILAFTFVCHDSTFMLYSTLRNPSTSRWSRVTRNSLSGAAMLCLLTAIPGYISFKGKVEEDLLNNYAQDDAKIIIVRVFFVLAMALTYPVSFFISRHILNDLLYRFQNRGKFRLAGTPSGPAVQLIPLHRHIFLTTTLFFSSVLVVMFVDQPGVAMSLTGNVCAVAVAFILPPACCIRSQLNRSKRTNNSDLDEPLYTGNRRVRSHSDAEVIEGVDLRNSQEDFSTFTAEKTPRLLGPAVLLVSGIATMIFCTAQTLLNI